MRYSYHIHRRPIQHEHEHEWWDILITSTNKRFNTRSGGADTAQGGKGGGGGKVGDSGSVVSPGFPPPHNLLDEHDAEVGRVFFSQSPLETLFIGPDSSPGSNASIEHAKYVQNIKQTWKRSNRLWRSARNPKLQGFQILLSPAKNQYVIYPSSQEHITFWVGQKRSKKQWWWFRQR